MPDSQPDPGRGDSKTPTFAKDFNLLESQPPSDGEPSEDVSEGQHEEGDAESTEAETLNLGGMIGEVTRDEDGGAHLTKEQLDSTHGDLKYHRQQNTQASMRMGTIEKRLDTLIANSEASQTTSREADKTAKLREIAANLQKANDAGDVDAGAEALAEMQKAGVISNREAKTAQPAAQPQKTSAQVRADDEQLVRSELDAEELQFPSESIGKLTDRSIEIYKELQERNPGADSKSQSNRAIRKAHAEMTSKKSTKKPRSKTRTSSGGASAGEFSGVSDNASGPSRRPASDMTQFD